MKTSSQHKKHFEQLAGRITAVEESLEHARQEVVALSDIHADLIKERNKAILDARGVVTPVEAGLLLGLHESTIRTVLAKELRRHGMGLDLKPRR
jgi:hypothetical protein